MTIARISRSLLRMYGIVSCVLLASVNVARADLNVDRTTDNAAHQTIRNNSFRCGKGRPVTHLRVVPQGRAQDRETVGKARELEPCAEQGRSVTRSACDATI